MHYQSSSTGFIVTLTPTDVITDIIVYRIKKKKKKQKKEEKLYKL